MGYSSSPLCVMSGGGREENDKVEQKNKIKNT